MEITIPQDEQHGLFSGPLDLLLQLIEQQEMDITQISLAAVTEQFLEHVRKIEKLDTNQLADYLSIAAKLLVLKSKQLLPTLEIERDEEEPAFDLESQLLLYKQFKEAAKYLKKLDANRQQSLNREPAFEEKINFYPDPAVTADLLHANILKVLKELEEIIKEPEGTVREIVSLQERIATLQERIRGQAQSKLSELLAGAKDRTEVIVTFLALLELTKQRIIVVEQDELFADITINRIEETNIKI